MSIRVRNWRVDIARLLGTAIGPVVALTIAGWPSNTAEAAWVGVGGAVVGLLVVFAAEHHLHLLSEVKRLQHAERELASEREQRVEERRLWDYQLALAQRESAINAVAVEVFGGALTEAMQTKQFLPLSAILARQEMLQTARNIDKPLPPLNEWKTRLSTVGADGTPPQPPN